MIQLYIRHTFIFRFFSLTDYYKILGIVPCAIQYVLVGYLGFFNKVRVNVFIDSLFIWLCWVFIVACGILLCHGRSFIVAQTLVAAHRCYQLWHMGLVDPGHV